MTVSGGEARHLAKVLRVAAGDRLVAFDGSGREWDATVVAVSATRIELLLQGERATAAESPCRVLLGQGVGKADKLETVIRAATELGVAAVVPVRTERAVAAAEGRDRVERWRKIAAEACKQCGRARIPEIHAPETLAEFLARAAAFDVKVVPWEGADAGAGLREHLRERGPAASAAVLVGPEGGLSAREVDAAREAGFAAVRLGPRILRTETAGIVSVAALQLLLGDLG